MRMFFFLQEEIRESPVSYTHLGHNQAALPFAEGRHEVQYAHGGGIDPLVFQKEAFLGESGFDVVNIDGGYIYF